MNYRHLRIFNKGVVNIANVGIGKENTGSLRDGQNIRTRSGSIQPRDGSSLAVDFSGIAGGVTIVRLWEAALEGQDAGVWVFWYAYVFSSGTILRYHDQSDDTTIQITNALSNPDIWALNAFDHQFISNNEDALHIHAGSPGSWMPVGLAPPVAAPATATAPGVLTGFKKYKYAYATDTSVADRPYRIESNPSPEVQVTAAAPGLINQQVTLTMVPSGEAHADNYIIYATELYTDINNPETIFYEIATPLISGGNTYVDNLATPIVTTEDTTDKGVPPVCGQMVYHLNRLFLIGDPDNKSIVYYSALGRPFYFPDDNWDEISRDDGTELTAMAVLGQTLYLFKTNSIYEWTGDPTLISPIHAVQASQTQNQASIGVGCRDALSVAQTSDLIVFRAADDHVYMLTRTELRKLSAGQETDVKSLAVDATGAIFDDYYILHSGGTTLVWDLRTGAYQGKDTGITTSKFLVDHNGELMYGDEDRIIQLYDPTTDTDEDAGALTKFAQLPYIRFAEDEQQARIRRIRATTRDRLGTFLITTFDEDETQLDQGNNFVSDRHYSLPIGARCQFGSVKIQWADPSVIQSVGIGFLRRGRRH